MCQLCNLIRLSDRMTTPSRSLSNWGQFSSRRARNFRQRARREQLPRSSKSLVEVIVQPPSNPMSDRLI